jgi:hypothetical protein
MCRGALSILQGPEAPMALETFVAPVRTDEKSVVKKGLHKVSSSGPVNGCAATGRATSGMSCTEYEFHDAPFRAKLHSVNRRCEGDGSNQTAVNPKREPQSYSQDTPYFNSTLLAALIAPISFEFSRNCPTSQTALSRLFNIDGMHFCPFLESHLRRRESDLGLKVGRTGRTVSTLSPFLYPLSTHACGFP